MLIKTDMNIAIGSADFEFLEAKTKPAGASTFSVSANRPIKSFYLLIAQLQDLLYGITNLRNGEVIPNNYLDLVNLNTGVVVTQNVTTYTLSGNSMTTASYNYSSAAKQYTPLVFYN